MPGSPGESRRHRDGDRSGNTLGVRVSNLGTQPRLFRYKLQGGIGKIGTKRGAGDKRRSAILRMESSSPKNRSPNVSPTDRPSSDSHALSFGCIEPVISSVRPVADTGRKGLSDLPALRTVWPECPRWAVPITK